MKYLNRDGKSNQRRISKVFGFIAVIVFASISYGQVGALASGSATDEKQADPPIVAKCKADLAKRLE